MHTQLHQVSALCQSAAWKGPSGPHWMPCANGEEPVRSGLLSLKFKLQTKFEFESAVKFDKLRFVIVLRHGPRSLSYPTKVLLRVRSLSRLSR